MSSSAAPVAQLGVAAQRPEAGAGRVDEHRVERPAPRERRARGVGRARRSRAVEPQARRLGFDLRQLAGVHVDGEHSPSLAARPGGRPCRPAPRRRRARACRASRANSPTSCAASSCTCQSPSAKPDSVLHAARRFERRCPRGESGVGRARHARRRELREQPRRAWLAVLARTHHAAAPRCRREHGLALARARTAAASAPPATRVALDREALLSRSRGQRSLGGQLAQDGVDEAGGAGDRCLSASTVSSTAACPGTRRKNSW